VQSVSPVRVPFALFDFEPYPVRTSAARGIEPEQALPENDLVEPAGVLDFQMQVDHRIMVHEVPVARESYRQPMRCESTGQITSTLAETPRAFRSAGCCAGCAGRLCQFLSNLTRGKEEAMARQLVTEDLWKRVKDLLPKPTSPVSKGGRPPVDPRRALESIIFVLKTGSFGSRHEFRKTIPHQPCRSGKFNMLQLVISGLPGDAEFVLMLLVPRTDRWTHLKHPIGHDVYALAEGELLGVLQHRIATENLLPAKSYVLLASCAADIGSCQSVGGTRSSTLKKSKSTKPPLCSVAKLNRAKR
jgi:hypothetical protein